METEKKELPRFAFYATLIIDGAVSRFDHPIIATGADHAIFKLTGFLISVRERCAKDAGRKAYDEAIATAGGMAGPEAVSLAEDAREDAEAKVICVPLPTIIGIELVSDNEVIA